MRTSHSLLCLFSFCCLLPMLPAQEEVAFMQELTGEAAEEKNNEQGIPVLVENAPDHSAGFAVFAKRIPAIPADALPGNLVMRNGQYDPYSDIYRQGNIPAIWTWKTEDGTEKAVSLTQEFTGNVALTPPSKNIHNGNIWRDMQEADYGIQVQLLDPILKKLFTQLKKGPEESWEVRMLMQNPGNLMLFAVRLHQVGRVEEANQLATFLFSHIGDKKQVLMAGLSSIADAVYSDLMTTRRQNGDNTAFVAGCEAFLQQQGRYWRHSAELSKQLPEWKRMLELPADYVPEVAGLTLSEDQKALYRDLWTAPEVIAVMQSTLGHKNWLLAPRGVIHQNLRHQIQNAGGTETSLLIYRTHDMGLEALPVFVAMLQDPRFSPPMKENTHLHVTRHVYSSSEKPTLPKPATLSYPLLSILNGIKPSGSNAWNTHDPERAIPAILGHINRLKGKSNTEIALFYLNQGRKWDTPTEAIYTLASSEDPKHHEAVTRWLSTMENPHGTVSILIDVHTHKPERGAEWLTTLKTRLQQPAMMQRFEGDDYMKQMIEQIDKALDIKPEKTETPTGPSLSEAIQTWIDADNPHNHTGTMTMLKAAKPMNMGQIQAVFAEKIRKADSKVAQMHLLNLVNRIVEQGGVEIYGGHYHNNQMVYYLNPDQEELQEEAVAQQKEEALYEWDPSVWLPLLEDESSEDAQYLARLLGGVILLSLYLEDGYEMLYQIRPLHDTDYNRRVATWAAQILQETEDMPELENFPDSSTVDETRKTAMDQTLMSGTLEEFAALLKDSTDSERLVLLTLLQQENVMERDGLKDKLLQDHQQIDTIVWMDRDRMDLGLKPGDNLNLDKMNQLLSLAAEQAKAGKKGAIQLTANPLYQGTSVSYQRNMIGDLYGTTPGVVIQGVGANQTPFRVTLPLDQFPVTLKAPTEEERDKAAGDTLLLLMGEAGDEPADAVMEASRFITDSLTELPPAQGLPKLTFIFIPASTTP